MKIRGIVLWVATFATIANNMAESDGQTTNSNVCGTPTCIDAASELSKSVNLRVDPCIDFHEFACGGFLRSLTSPGYASYKKVSEKRIWRDIDELLTTAVEPNEPGPFKLVKTFYKSCVDEATIEAKSLEKLRGLVRELGGWPVVDGISWTGENFDWRRPFYMFRKDEFDEYWKNENRLGYLIHFRIPNNESSELIDSMIFSHGPTWSDDPNDLDDTGSRLYKYYESLINMAVMLGANSQRARAELRAVIEFEKRLAALHRGQEHYTVTTIRGFIEKFPSVPWMTYLRNFVPSSFKLDPYKYVSIAQPDYYVQLEALMANTPKRIQADYIMAKIVLRYGIYSTKNMSRAVETALGRYFDSRDRRTYCRSETMKYMWRAVTALYADKYYSKEMRNDILNMSLNIQEERTRQVIKNGKRYWTEVEDREEVEQRMGRTMKLIGYPSFFTNISRLEELYENLTFSEDDYLGNMQALSRYDHELSIKEITRPYSLWTLERLYQMRGGAIGTTGSDIDDNSIMIGNEYIRDLYYGIGRPNYMNYGGLGTFIGHEMAHVLFNNDNIGIKPYTGLLWRREFENNTRCIIDQYNNFQIDNMGNKMKGGLSLNGNVADIGGTRLAYEAYKKSVIDDPEEPKLPGFEKYSGKQMFWLNLASVRCDKIPAEEMAHRIALLIDHAIEKFRIIGMISNMPEFAEDFNCTATSIVNPVKRCDVL